jgi:hypothetical protein
VLGGGSPNARAWTFLFAALALHVVDEASSGFLPFYNGIVEDLRARLGSFPMPTFTFPVWISGLTLTVLVGFLVVPLVRKGGRLWQAIAFVFGVLMIANALGHLLGSLYMGWWIPGSRSAPILFLTAMWLVGKAMIGDWRKAVFVESTSSPVDPEAS